MPSLTRLNRRRLLQMLACTPLASHSIFASTGTHAQCNSVVDACIRDHRFQGVVALGRAGKPVFWRTLGFANVEARTPMAQQTAFCSASISKMLTTVSVLRLQEQGQLGLDQPIRTYLPYFRADLGSRLTLRSLLANNSGVPNLFAAARKADPSTLDHPLATPQAVHRFCEGDLIFNPGERFDYSLSNWILVLAIIESVTQQDYATAMRRLTLRQRNPTRPAHAASPGLHRCRGWLLLQRH